MYKIKSNEYSKVINIESFLIIENQSIRFLEFTYKHRYICILYISYTNVCVCLVRYFLPYLAIDL